MTFVLPITYWITIVMGAAGAVIGVITFVDALTRRADAFAAADKQTKGTWTGITALCGLLLVLGSAPLLVFPPPSLLWLAAMVGSLIYLLDVRPGLKEVTGGTSRW